MDYKKVKEINHKPRKKTPRYSIIEYIAFDVLPVPRSVSKQEFREDMERLLKRK